MSRYLLDTNAVSDLADNPAGKVAQGVRRVGSENICTSIIVASEVAFGLEQKGSKRLTRQMTAVLSSIAVKPLEAPADRHYGRLRAMFRKQGKPIGPNDLFVAAHALALGAVLITDNEKEFVRVPGLKVENWLRG